MGAPFGEMAGAYKELADEDLVRDLEADNKPKVANFASPDSSPESQNIFGGGSYSIIGYDQETFEPLTARSTTKRLGDFSERTNSEIAIGWTRNSVYNSVQQGESVYAKTYYPIGDPPIMVTVNTNGEDPSGDFWKCDHGFFAAEAGYTTDELERADFTVVEAATRPKNVIIEATDGVRYCMPFQKAKATSGKRATLIDDWADSIARGDGRPGGGFATAGYHLDPYTGEYVESTAGEPQNSVLPFPDWIRAVENSSAVLSFKVPYPSTIIDRMENVPGTPATSEATSLQFFKEDRLKSLYKERQVPRENEFKVTYNILEEEALKARFGQPNDLNTTLNNLYMGMANFLATTFIEVAYTFKKVDTQQLTPEQITPANLALSSGTNIQAAIASTDDAEFSTAGYYPSHYVDTYSGEAYRAPETPTGGFFDLSYYYMMNPTLVPTSSDTAGFDAAEMEEARDAGSKADWRPGDGGGGLPTGDGGMY